MRFFKNPDRRALYKDLVHLALPVVLQNALNTALNLLDSLMIGRISQDSAAELVAVGYANTIFFALSLIMMAFCCAAQIFSAQYYGSGDGRSVKHSLGMGIIACCGFSLIAQVVFLLLPEQSIRIFSADPRVIALGGDYMRIVAWSYLATGVTFIYSGVLRSVRQVKLPTAVSVLGIGVNAVLNYLLIYGKLGFPVMGVRGAAIATLASRLVQAVVLLIAVYVQKRGLNARLRELFGFGREFAARYMKYTLPVVFNEGLWAIGTSIYSVYYGHIGTDAAAAAQIAATIEEFAWIVVAGIGSVTAIIIGNALGAGESREKLRFFSRELQHAILGAAVIMGVLIALCAPVFPRLYSINETTYADSVILILILAALIPFKAGNFNRVIGILRAGGDTRFTAITESLLVWCVSVPAGYLLYRFTDLGIVAVFIAVHIDEIIKLPILAKRVRREKWIKNLTAQD